MDEGFCLSNMQSLTCLQLSPPIEIEWQKLDNLKKLVLGNDKNIRGISKLKNLRELLVISLRQSAFQELTNLPKLEILDIGGACLELCYKRRAGITEEQASRVSSVAYIGIHEYSTREIESRFSTAGMEFSTFVGITDKSKEEFMRYFDQSEYMQALQDYQAGTSKKKPNPELRCQFCKDVGLDFYYPELLNIEFSDNLIPVNAEILLRKVISEPMLHYNLPRRLQEKGIDKANCAFCYVANGFRNHLLDKHIHIYMKNTPKSIKRKKKDIDESDNYNGLFF